tara:strand:- start:182 stop:1024 length:843 start_codon:yes stop_codon:yes gene_type:complete
VLIATWNVNSIRTRLKQVQDWLKEVKPDLLCLQETKVEDNLFPKKAFEELGYYVSISGQKAYNGVALLSSSKTEDTRLGLTGELEGDVQAIQLSNQKRIISTLIEGIRVVNVYVPNGSQLASEKYLYKIEWLQCLKKYLNSIQNRDEPICLLGDFNIALEDIDIHNPSRLSGGIMASQAERNSLKDLLGNNLEDVFRVFETETNHWSWWDYRSSGWENDRGWRIDHIYLSNDLLSNAKSCKIFKKVRGNLQPSDHAPVAVDLNWPPDENDNEFLEFANEL